MHLPAIQTKKKNEAVLVLVTTTVISNLGSGIISPILPLYASSFGVTIFWVGLMVAAYGVARIFMDIPSGRLADRYGRRPMIIAGTLLIGLSSLGSALASEFWQLVAFRLVMGTGSALYTTTSQSALADLSTPRTRGQFLSLHQGAHQIGNSLGPAAGGFLAEYLGLRAPFFAYAAVAFIACLWAYFRIPETSRSRAIATTGVAGSAETGGTRKHSPSVIKALLLDASFLLVAFLAFTNFLTHSGAQQTIIPLYGTQNLRLTEGQLGLGMTVIGVATLITSLLAGWLSDRIGRKRVIVPGMIILGLSVAFFGVSSNMALFVGAGVLMGSSRGFAGSVPTAYAADIAPGGNFGATLGLYRTFADIGGVTGPLLMGWLADASGSLSLPLFASGALTVLAVIPFGLFARETVRTGSRKE
ncbi:MAG: MFS transporter [Chloroflexi bacterium]|nr:MFS transporter [Chloroflexota bacterium]